MKDCLIRLKKVAEIIVFTASHHSYANVILDYIDPNNDIFDYRLFRSNCVITKEKLYVKDLRVLKGRDLKHVVLIDNAAYSFAP